MRMIPRIGLMLISVLIILTACFAQNNAEKNSPSLNDMPPPQAEMQSLARALVGKWSTTYKFEPSGKSSSGGTGTGEEVWRTGPGGYVLMEEEHIRAPYGERFLFALHWWDKSTNSLRGMLCNNSGPAACNVDSYFNSSIKWDGKRLVIDLQFPQDGKKMLWHEIWSDITDTSFTQTGEIGEVGSPLRLAVSIHGTKTSDSDRAGSSK